MGLAIRSFDALQASVIAGAAAIKMYDKKRSAVEDARVATFNASAGGGAVALLAGDERLRTRLSAAIDRKSFGAYYTPGQITSHLSDRAIHAAVVGRANEGDRRFADLAALWAGLDDALADRMLDSILPGLSVVDPACGSGEFLLAAMETLRALYARLFAWIDRRGGSRARRRLAKIRHSGMPERRWIAQRVLADNLHGVDLMPEAIEMTRLRLLDAAGDATSSPRCNLAVGNALIGLLHSGAAIDDATADALLLEQMCALGVRHERPTWDHGAAKPGPPARRPLDLADIAALWPLHWPVAFGDVMRRGGFDVVLANPPWDVFKPNGKEFFLSHSELVTRKSMTIADFEAEQSRLLLDADVRAAWLDYLGTFPHQSAYFRAAPEYAHQTAQAGGRRVGSDLNFYKLFVERCRRLLREGGECGLVVPSGLYTDLGAKGLRQMLFATTTIRSLMCIENRAAVFDGVHRMFKFIVLRFCAGGQTTSFPAAFMRRDVNELHDFPGRGGVAIDVDLVRALSPDSLSVLEFKSDLDVAIARKMARFPLLGKDVPGRWRPRLRREFDMTLDARLFHSSPAPGRLPLFEGKMIWQFEAGFAAPRYWVDASEGGDSHAGKSEARTAVPPDHRRQRLVIRAVASNVNQRTLIAAIVPSGCFCGNSLLVDTALDAAQSLYLLGVLNSFVLDWLLRLKVTTNLNMFHLYQLPVPRPEAGDEAFDTIANLADRLMHAATADPAALRRALDARVARLYGLNKGEFAHVLGTFPLVDQTERAAVLDGF